MIQVPGGNKPHVPPQITPKEVGKKDATKPEQKAPMAAKQAAAKSHIGRGPELDARAIAVRLAALATEAKKKEIAHEEFERILDQVINLTGLEEPEAAMTEANKRLQKEIEAELDKIKKNKDLMEEAEDWERFGELLSSMAEGQAEAILAMMKNSIHEL